MNNAAIPENKLHEKVIVLWRIHGIIAALIIGGILAAIAASLAIFSPEELLIPLIVFICAMVAFVIVGIVIFPAIRYRIFRYSISDDEIVIRKGIVIIVNTVVPMIKIQYTDTVHGPIMRAMNLASVRIMTAGGTVNIPGLLPEEAEQMAARITALVKTVRENV